MADTQIPAVLQRRPQWVCWRTEDRDGEATKVPVDPAGGGYASVRDTDTWSDYATAQAYARATAGVDGIGFVFTADDPYAGVDLDACREPATGEVEDWAIEVLRALDSYTEYSPSGTGFHVIVEGTVPSGGNRADQLELYDENRYFTVTGDRVPGAPTEVEQRNDALQAVHEEYIGSEEPTSDVEGAPPSEPLSLSDEALLEKAQNAANGEKFRALWEGDTLGYDSHSEADQALCTLLAFWTGGDPQRIERLFDQSGLTRDKWRDRPDYRKRTIRNAIRHCSAFYDGRKGEESS
ncbi:hypothetical protein NGM10_02020 [Halorussus salilacus]|uniref:phage NrS-1 polymerase family protein n=1 Tax=Halorussus salilacus TaxID=2953750 RepID=UPI0020A061DD|nr:hypothetical protein [Halorussus salilacus]USZ68528.1 hypothetical protein NGM10_02020 [Halorussus salilacus]